MTKNELNSRYFAWMCQLVCDEQRYPERLYYQNLLRFLHNVEFTYTIEMDGNREADGIDLRYRFGYENSYDDSMIATFLDDRPCSVLEMMIALAVRCEENIMSDPDNGDRTGKWFWLMIENLGLYDMNDYNFDADFTQDVIGRFLDRKYKRNGKGGLFVIYHCKYDLRNVEIWYQMCWYLDKIT